MNMNTHKVYYFIDNNKFMKTISDEDINNIVQLKERELNIINNKRLYAISELLIKEDALVLKLDYIKAIINKNTVILFDILNNDAESFSLYLHTKLKDKSESTFELNILESILSHLGSTYDLFLQNKMTIFLNLIQNITKNVDNRTNFNNLVKIHNELVTFQTKVNDIKRVIEELLESDEDMADIYISRSNNPVDNHDEVELILENYEKHMQEILNEISGMLKELDINQKVMDLNYADNRNKIALLNLKVSYITLVIAIISLVPSIFGMNIVNKTEDNFGAFIGIFVLIFIAVVGSLGTFYTLEFLKV